MVGERHRIACTFGRAHNSPTGVACMSVGASGPTEIRSQVWSEFGPDRPKTLLNSDHSATVCRSETSPTKRIWSDFDLRRGFLRPKFLVGKSVRDLCSDRKSLNLRPFFRSEIWSFFVVADGGV